jgi:hypothetical protein
MLLAPGVALGSRSESFLKYVKTHQREAYHKEHLPTELEP